jgi:hypothetical protein
MLELSPITKDQWKKVVKAAIYSFVAAAIAALFTGGNSSLDKKALIAAATSGVNAAIVTVKQVFTQG